MTRTYVDMDAAGMRGAAEAASDPAAVRSLQFLADAGHEVVIVASDPAAIPDPLRDLVVDVVPHVPDSPASRAWYLTTAVERCLGVSAKLRTVLIGAAPPPGSIHRCDTVARDIQAAVLEILASEAMPSR